MKRLVLTLSLVLLASATAFALELPKILGGGAPAAETAPPEEKVTYIIHLVSGGTIETNNYTIEKDSVRIIMLTGAVYLDKSLVKSIEEVRGEEQETIQTLKLKPQKQGGQTPTVVPGANAPEPKVAEPVDLNGHSKAWWQKRVKEWTDKRKEALERQKKADEEWNNYDGILSTMKPGTYTDFDIKRYEDWRGAARTESDKAESDVSAADKMLNVTIPEEARKADAPPGWLRLD